MILEPNSTPIVWLDSSLTEKQNKLGLLLDAEHIDDLQRTCSARNLTPPETRFSLTDIEQGSSDLHMC